MNEEQAGGGNGGAVSRFRAAAAGGTGWFAVFGAALSVLFLPILAKLVVFCLRDNVNSYNILVPAMSAWLVWNRRRDIQPAAGRPNLPAAALLLVGAPLLAYGLWFTMCAGWNVNDRLSVAALVFVSALLGGAAALVGPACLRSALGPALMLFFFVPVPSAAKDFLSVGLQHVSAWTLAWLLHLTTIPVFREGTVFHFPGLTLQVAEECSGIRSTVALFVTSLAGGVLFLRAPWRRAVLAASVFPIAALRNAVRILALAVGTLYVDPGVLESPLHRRGGPLFFVMSLLPLFVIMIILYRGEKKSKEGVSEL
jgi:exosortase